MKNSEIYYVSDKNAAPFLLAASFQGLIRFEGSEVINHILYWRFSPKEKALPLVEKLVTGSEPPLPARNLLDAVATWWKQVAEIKGGRYGR